jgi:hypothetical protein
MYRHVGDRWHRVTESPQLLGEQHPHWPIDLGEQLSHGLFFPSEGGVEILLSRIAVRSSRHSFHSILTVMASSGNGLQRPLDNSIAALIIRSATQVGQRVP